jgi:hypothetical protein
MTTTIGTTTTLMPTPPLLHVAQKGTFKIFKCKKHEETLANFFLGALILSIIDSQPLYRKSALLLDPFAAPTTTDTLDTTGLLSSSLFLSSLHKISHSMTSSPLGHVALA